jgi:hypothetical protein
MDIKWIKGLENDADAFTVGQDVHMRKTPTSEQGGCQEESQGTQKGSQDFN